MQQQEQQLKALAARYKDLNIIKQLKSLNKEAFYYSQRLQNFKQTLNGPEKTERETLKLLRKNEGFKNWMQQNGQLAALFGNPGATAAQSIAGLQTRQNMQQLLQSRIGGSVQQVQQLITNQVQQAQLSSVRNRLQQQLNSVSNMANNSSGDITMPDFKPGLQTTPFLKRLEKGWNLQTTQRKGQFPAVNELGISLGYRISNTSVAGVGGAYRFGLGEDIRKIKWTNEGISLRTYLDVKWRGNWWISGGYEKSYWNRFSNNAFNSIAWQRSGLIGLTKKVSLKKNKEMKVQMLYDFLNRHPANTFPFTVRVGKSF